jgi:predicted component of type VI protein secretion system
VKMMVPGKTRPALHYCTEPSLSSFHCHSLAIHKTPNQNMANPMRPTDYDQRETLADPISALDDDALITSTSSSNHLSLSTESELISLHGAQFRGAANITSTTATKRSASEDPEDKVNKRVKASHDPPNPDSVSSPPQLDLDIPRSAHSTVISTRTPAGGLSHNTSLKFDTASSSSPSSSSHHALTSATLGDDMVITRSTSAIPHIPLDAVGTLQQASVDMLNALVRKDAVDRETQLLVAVGTIRTCLDVHFVPHMGSWKEGAIVVEKVLEPLPVIKGDPKQLSITTCGPPRTS